MLNEGRTVNAVRKSLTEETEHFETYSASLPGNYGLSWTVEVDGEFYEIAAGESERLDFVRDGKDVYVVGRHPGLGYTSLQVISPEYDSYDTATVDGIAGDLEKGTTVNLLRTDDSAIVTDEENEDEVSEMTPEEVVDRFAHVVLPESRRRFAKRATEAEERLDIPRVSHYADVRINREEGTLTAYFRNDDDFEDNPFYDSFEEMLHGIANGEGDFIDDVSEVLEPLGFGFDSPYGEVEHESGYGDKGSVIFDIVPLPSEDWPYDYVTPDMLANATPVSLTGDPDVDIKRVVGWLKSKLEPHGIRVGEPRFDRSQYVPFANEFHVDLDVRGERVELTGMLDYDELAYSTGGSVDMAFNYFDGDVWDDFSDTGIKSFVSRITDGSASLYTDESRRRVEAVPVRTTDDGDEVVDIDFNSLYVTTKSMPVWYVDTEQSGILQKGVEIMPHDFDPDVVFAPRLTKRHQTPRRPGVGYEEGSSGAVYATGPDGRELEIRAEDFFSSASLHTDESRGREESSFTDFDEWMRAVDLEVQAIAGVSYRDLPDWNYRDAYESGATPKEAAEEALEYGGFRF
jgi:hypothetical protein